MVKIKLLPGTMILYAPTAPEDPGHGRNQTQHGTIVLSPGTEHVHLYFILYAFVGLLHIC